MFHSRRQSDGHQWPPPHHNHLRVVHLGRFNSNLLAVSGRSSRDTKPALPSHSSPRRLAHITSSGAPRRQSRQSRRQSRHGVPRRRHLRIVSSRSPPAYAPSVYSIARPLGAPHGARPHGARPHGARPHGARPHGARPHGARPHGASCSSSLHLHVILLGRLRRIRTFVGR